MTILQRWIAVFLSVLAIFLLFLSKHYFNSRGTTDEDRDLGLHSASAFLSSEKQKQSVADDEQRMRVSLVERQCRKYRVETSLNTTSNRSLKHLIVDDKHRLMYCYIPKIACTNWKKLLVFLNDENHRYQRVEDILPYDAHHSATRRTLEDYSFEEIQTRLQTYLKFVFVREPMERLISAYANKFTRRNYSGRKFQKLYGRQIIKRFRENPSARSLQEGHDVTFQEFIRYVVDHKTLENGPSALNEHWRQYYHLCYPCLVKYDFIGHYEKLMEDAQKLLRMARLDHLVSFPKPLPGQGKTKSIVEDYYRNLSSQDVHALWRLYNVDYVMFGYSFPKHLYEKKR